jgi:uncharacterized protein (DUF433 family)
MFAIVERLGIGIYSPAEAAFYARVSRRIMTRWLFGEGDAKPVIDRQIRDASEKVVTFLDFIQTLAVREVRNRHGLSLQKIRLGVEQAQKRYSIEYPLARRHTIYLFSDQKGEGHGEIVIKLPDKEYIQLTGKDKDNLMMRPVVEMFLEDLHFDPQTGLATQYSPMVDDGASIVLNPHRRFGEPIVDPGGYTAETLWHATNTEGGIEEAAEAYGVTVSEVRLANKYYDTLLPD